LATEAYAKLIDEIGAEGVGMAQRDNLAANAEIVGRPETDEFLRERGTRPRHCVIAVLGWAEQPLKKILTLASLMIDLDRKIDGILAASSLTFIVGNCLA
jgi:hypothetical protein